MGKYVELVDILAVSVLVTPRVPKIPHKTSLKTIGEKNWGFQVKQKWQNSRKAPRERPIENQLNGF